MKNIIFLFSIIAITLSCSNNDSELDSLEFVSQEVLVGIKSGTNINAVFEFINQFDHKVESIRSLTFTSNLPSNKLQYILESLNEKTYTNDGTNWFVTGYLRSQTNQITIFPKLFGMGNLDHQNDWLVSMNELGLNEKHNDELNSGVILFEVPIGKEIEWRNKFKNYNIVDWTELNYIADIQPSTD